MIALYYSWYSICSEKVLLCLFEKNLPFEGTHIDLFNFEQVQPEYLAINPNGKLPAMVHDGEAIVESSLINEFLDDYYPETKLTPDNPDRKTEMQIWVKYAEENMFPSAGLISQVNFIAEELKSRWSEDDLKKLIRKKVNKMGVIKQLKAVREGFSNEDINEANEKIADALNRMETALGKKGPWLVGDYSLADIAVVPNLYRLDCLGMKKLWEDNHPLVTDWYNKLIDRPAFKKTYLYSPPKAPD
jgi:glutathione S-transferase